MYTLGPEDKATMIMAYTPNMLVRGEVVTMKAVRVNIWLRTEGAPSYIHVHKPQIIVFGGGAPKSLSYSEILLPVSDMIGFHTVPPTDETMDYDPNEPNRVMEPMSVLMSTFIMKGKMRKSAQTDIVKTIELAKSKWISYYDVEVSNPSLPQLHMTVPLMLITPAKVSFALG